MCCAAHTLAMPITFVLCLGIVDYMEKQIGDPSKEKTDLKTLQSFMSVEDVTVVGFFDNAEQDVYTLYQEAGEWHISTRGAQLVK